MDKKFLITGARGFIGSHLVDELVKDPKNIIYAYDRKAKVLNYKNVIEIEGDLKTTFQFVENIDYVIHLAAFNGTKHFYTQSYDVIKDNIIPTLNLLDYYRNTNLKKFIYAGTPESTVVSTEYFNYSLPTDENAPVGVIDIKNKRWSYANSKVLGEQAVIASNLPYTIIRYNNIYGPRQIDHFISDFYERICKDKYILYGYKNTRTFLFIDDAIEATKKLIYHPNTENDIFNVGGEKEIPIIEVAQMIMNLLNKKDNKLILYDALEGSTMRRWPDVSKLKTLTNWKQNTSLREGLIKTLDL